MKNSTTLFALLSMLVSITASAQESGVSETGIRYSEISAGYESLSNSKVTMTGYVIAGSALVDKNIFIDANYADVAKKTTVSRTTTINAGYRFDIAPNADLYAKLGYVSTSGVNSDTSYLMTGGARVMIAPNIELAGHVTYSGLKRASIFYGSSLGYYLTQNLAIRGQVRLDNATTSNTVYMASIGHNF